jgi:hypothetical protein
MQTKQNNARDAALAKMGLVFKNNAWRTKEGHKKIEEKQKIIKSK